MEPKKEAKALMAKAVIEKLKSRNMAGFYFETADEAVKAILEMMEKGSKVANGGSMSIVESGLMDAVKSGDYNYVDRMQVPYKEVVDADYYLMSTNAITIDGELVNIDGAGNRVACLIHGPKNVIILAGMNKICSTLEDAHNRVRNIATPANTIRLNKNTPCAQIGHCSNCLSADCICNQIVITRRSMIPERIKVFLVGEELGY